MNRESFKKDKKRIFFYCGFYSLFCEVISLFVLGFDVGILTGLIMGTCCVMVNFFLLEVSVDCILLKKNILLAFLLQSARLFIYVAVGFICFRLLGIRALIAFGTAAIGIVIGAALTYGKEGRNG